VKVAQEPCVMHFPTVLTSGCSIPDKTVFLTVLKSNYLMIYCSGHGSF
jgi:hypothetical protein